MLLLPHTQIVELWSSSPDGESLLGMVHLGIDQLQALYVYVPLPQQHQWGLHHSKR